ncbi:MAG: hypothetical protein JEY99_10630 [Spirochaetales bacterium]|nr:hypothetical protein [Spirochaetales bacterium]
MTIKDFIESSRVLFKPKTPNAALLAVEKGILPVQSYIYKITSVTPLYEEPFDLEEIQRILSMQDTDLETKILLMKILKKLSYHEDPEIALFAAESMNAIESRYNNKIEKLKKEIEENISLELVRECANEFYEMAVLSSQEVIKKFYLKESFLLMRKLEGLAGYSKDDGLFTISLLNELSMFGQSKQIVSKMKKEFGENDSELLETEAMIEYSQGNFLNVIKIYIKLGSIKKSLDTEELEKLKFWAGI